MIVEDHKYETIRVEEPDLFDWKPLPILQFAMPTFGKKTVIRRTRSLELDKHPNPDFKLKDYLFSDDRQMTDNMLDLIQKRKCHLKIEKLRH